MVHNKEKKMNYGSIFVAFLFGTIASFVFASTIQEDSIVAVVIPETENMEAIWYPE